MMPHGHKTTNKQHMQEDQRHGRGVMIYVDGDRYEGNYARDRREGRGLYSFQVCGVVCMCLCVCFFFGGVRHLFCVFVVLVFCFGVGWGLGSFGCQPPTLCEPFFGPCRLHPSTHPPVTPSPKHTNRTHKTQNGDAYEGEWADHDRTGTGVFRGADGACYAGGWEVRGDVCFVYMICCVCRVGGPGWLVGLPHTHTHTHTKPSHIIYPPSIPPPPQKKTAQPLARSWEVYGPRRRLLLRGGLPPGAAAWHGGGDRVRNLVVLGVG